MSQICSKMAIFLFTAYFGGHFVTIKTIKVEAMPDFYTLAIVLINYYDETCEEQLLFFDLIGGPKQPLNARTPFKY